MVSRTRVKICGITRPEDGMAAAYAGTDAIGLVFYEKSPRYVRIKQAEAICAVLPPFVTTVALFVDASERQVQTVLKALPINLLQFHGSESAQDCGRYGIPWLKAIAMQPESNPVETMQAYPDASGFLLDAWQPDTFGGGGLSFDWDQMPAPDKHPLVLAGGLTPENVEQAVQQTRPFAVDVSSGVEISKGIKSTQKIEAFIRGVERGDENR